MRKKLLPILALAVFVAATAFAASLQDRMALGTDTGGSLTAVSTDVALKVRYVGGASGGGEVTVAAGGDISLTVATVADATTECPVSGAYGGIIDVSDTSCDTLGEVCDAINFSDDWQCVIVNGLRSDSSNNTLAAASISDADLKEGLSLLWDTAVALHMTAAILPTEDIGFYVKGAYDGADLVSDPFYHTQSALKFLTANITTSGAVTISAYSVKVEQKRSELNGAGTGFIGGSEIATTLFSRAGAATTVTKELDFYPYPITSRPGEKLVVRVAATTDYTSPVIGWNGVALFPQ